MGFQPKNNYPVKVSAGGYFSLMSIMGARLHVAEVLRAIAEAELAEQKEYLSFRIEQYEKTIKEHVGNEVALRRIIKRKDAEIERMAKAMVGPAPKPAHAEPKVTRKRRRRA